MPVDALTAGPGIGIGGSIGVPSIFNTGLVSIANSNLTGLSNIGTSSNVSLSNLGVLTLTGSSNVIVSIPTGNTNVYYQPPPPGQLFFVNNIPPSGTFSGPQTPPYPQYGPIFNTPPTFAGCGINPASFDFIEVSCEINATCYETGLENGFSFICLANDSPNINAVNYYGDQQYWVVNDNAYRLFPMYIRYTMKKSAGDFTNSSTSFNIYMDCRWSPFPNGFLMNNNNLSCQVRAFNSVS